MAIRGILFDKDGTVVDYWKTWVPINREVALFAAGGDAKLAAELLRHGGHDPETDRITPGTALAAGSVDDIANAFAAHLKDRAPPDLAAGIEGIFRHGGARHSALIAGARETIAELKARGFHIGLATNDSIGGLEASLAAHEILPLFDFTVGCDSGFGTKPARGMVHAFCNAVGVARSEVAMVGDAVHDLAMGRAAGVALNVGVLSGTSGPEDFEGLADMILDSINDLPARPEFREPGRRPSIWSRIRRRS
jgi:phosphoglycolate phosphatase